MPRIRPDEELMFNTGMDKTELESWRDEIAFILEHEPNATIRCHHPALLVYLATAELKNIRLNEIVQAAMWKRDDSAQA